MKNLFFLLFLLIIPTLVYADHVPGHVRGYQRKDGPYVPSYKRTLPNEKLNDNYGFPGNFNPNKQEITPGDPGTYLERHQQKQRDDLLNELLKKR